MNNNIVIIILNKHSTQEMRAVSLTTAGRDRAREFQRKPFGKE